ncbi:Lipase, partial [Cordylochernes scorpioides]
MVAILLSPSVSAEKDILDAYRFETDRFDMQRSLINSQDQTICWNHLGCFYTNGTFSHTNMVPAWVETTFEIHSRHVPVATVPFSRIQTVEQLVNPDTPITVIIHGFTESRQEGWIQDMTKAFLQQKDTTVVIVDWGPGAVFPQYYQSAVNTELVGRQIAHMLSYTTVPSSKIHLVGFSLGAHVAGFSGKWFKQKHTSLIGKITGQLECWRCDECVFTGLDPASLLFEGYGPSVRLDSEDAEYVEVLHTNAATRWLAGVGMQKAIGHSDIYPNGGRHQPGCPNNLMGGMGDMFNLGNIYQLELYPSDESSTSGSLQLHLQDGKGNSENHD